MSDSIVYVVAGRRPVAEMPPDEQPINRLAAVGPAALSGAELIALLLQTPDALDHAQDILTAAGGLDGLARCTAGELVARFGLDECQAARLVVAAEYGIRALTPPRLAPGPQIRNVSDAAALLVPPMSLLEKEEMRVVLLDGRHYVMEIVTAYVGNIGQIMIRAAEIFRPAVRVGATAIILAHNHPSGRADPSPEDLRTTKELNDIGRELGIDLLDHIVVGHGSYTSIREWSDGGNHAAITL